MRYWTGEVWWVHKSSRNLVMQKASMRNAGTYSSRAASTRVMCTQRAYRYETKQCRQSAKLRATYTCTLHTSSTENGIHILYSFSNMTPPLLSNYFAEMLISRAHVLIKFAMSFPVFRFACQLSIFFHSKSAHKTNILKSSCIYSSVSTLYPGSLFC